MNIPLPGGLYRQIAKDYNPKLAEMNICKYIEGLEKRIATLESLFADDNAETPEETHVVKRIRKKKTEE